ncbi:MAG: hypothetical protein Q4E24_16090 [bacterium]|nr:hypothetical protein [bacterium]
MGKVNLYNVYDKNGALVAERLRAKEVAKLTGLGIGMICQYVGKEPRHSRNYCIEYVGQSEKQKIEKVDGRVWKEQFCREWQQTVERLKGDMAHVGSGK